MKRFLLSCWNHRRRNLVLVILALIGLPLLNPYLRQSIFGPTIKGIPWCVWEAQVRERVHPEGQKSWFRETLELFGLNNRTGGLALASGGPDEQPLYRHLADDEDVAVRRFALSMLYNQWGVFELENLPILRAHLRDNDPLCRLHAASGAWGMTKDQELKTVVLPLIRHSDQDVHVFAIRVLCDMASTDSSLFDTMAALALDLDFGERPEAVKSMRYFGKRGVPVLAQSLRDTDGQVRRCAIIAMLSIGKDGLELIPILEEFRSDEDWEFQQAAEEALHKMDPKQFPKPPD